MQTNVLYHLGLKLKIWTFDNIFKTKQTKYFCENVHQIFNTKQIMYFQPF